MFCYLILLFSISVSGASVLNRIEQTRKDSTRLSQINLATRDMVDVNETQKDQEVLSRGIRDLLYWNRVLNSLKGSEGVNGEPSICQYFAHYYRKNALHSNHEDQMARKCRNTLRRVKKTLSARRS